MVIAVKVVVAIVRMALIKKQEPTKSKRILEFKTRKRQFQKPQIKMDICLQKYRIKIHKSYHRSDIRYP